MMGAVTTVSLSTSTGGPKSPRKKTDCSAYTNGKKVTLIQDDKALAVKDKKGVYLVKVTTKNRDKITFTIRQRRDDVVDIETANARLIAMDVDGNVFLADPANHSEVETGFRLTRHRKGKKIALYHATYKLYLGVGGFMGLGTKLSGHKERSHGELFEEHEVDSSD